MRKWRIGLLALTVVAAAPGPALATIEGTAHDLRTRLGTSEICVVCHTPHSAPESNSGPMWNHAVTTHTFTMHPRDTIDGVVDSLPSGSTKLCLSCHDGVTAVDSYGGATGTDLITGSASFGVDLSDDHPVSITYDPTADPDLRPTSTSFGGKTIGDFPESSKLQCSTCHDIHDNTYNPLLRESNSGSGICINCHNL